MSIQKLRATTLPAAAAGSAFLASIWDTLTSVRLFLWIASALLLAFILGTLIPQGQPAEVLLGRLGPNLGRTLRALGLDDLYRAGWFNGLLALLGLNLFACSIRRIKALGSRPGVFLTHAALLLILTGALLRGVLGERGILSLREGETADEFTSNDGRSLALPFRVHLNRFWIDYWEDPAHLLHLTLPVLGIQEDRKVHVGEKLVIGDAGAAIEVMAYYPDFVLTEKGVQTRSQEPRNPALELLYHRKGTSQRLWTFANFPDVHGDKFNDGSIIYRYLPGTIRQFLSELEIYEGSRKVAKKTIHVNEPISYDGYTIYQYSYDPKYLSSSAFLVAKDPGVPLVYVGFALLTLGLIWNLRWRQL